MSANRLIVVLFSVFALAVGLLGLSLDSKAQSGVLIANYTTTDFGEIWFRNGTLAYDVGFTDEIDSSFNTTIIWYASGDIQFVHDGNNITAQPPATPPTGWYNGILEHTVIPYDWSQEVTTAIFIFEVEFYSEASEGSIHNFRTSVYQNTTELYIYFADSQGTTGSSWSVRYGYTGSETDLGAFYSAGYSRKVWRIVHFPQNDTARYNLDGSKYLKTVSPFLPEKLQIKVDYYNGYEPQYTKIDRIVLRAGFISVVNATVGYNYELYINGTLVTSLTADSELVIFLIDPFYYDYPAQVEIYEVASSGTTTTTTTSSPATTTTTTATTATSIGQLTSDLMQSLLPVIITISLLLGIMNIILAATKD